MANITAEQVEKLRKSVEESKSLRTRQEERKVQLEKQQGEIHEEIRALGVEPDNLDQEIANAQKEIDDLHAQINALIPWDLLKAAGGGRGGY